MYIQLYSIAKHSFQQLNIILKAEIRILQIFSVRKQYSNTYIFSPL